MSDAATFRPAAGDAPRNGRGWALATESAAAVALLGLFGLLKTYALNPALSDENIYFYMCQRIADGAIPYRDFFFAHPPLHLLPGTILIALFGFSIPLLKAVPAASCYLAGLAVYRIARRVGVVEGLCALALFLFSYDLLRVSSHYTGVCEATALLAWACDRASAGRPVIAGVLAACAALVAFYAVPAAIGIAVWLLLRKQRSFWSFVATGAGCFTVANLALLVAFGRAYWDPVLRYHFLKPEGAEGQFTVIVAALVAENIWLIGSAPAVVIAWWAGRKLAMTSSSDAWWLAGAGMLMAGLHGAFLLNVDPIQTFYFAPAFPGLAIAGGIAYPVIARRVAVLLRSAGSRGAKAAALALAAGLALPAGLEVARLAAESVRSAAMPVGPEIRYFWRDAPLPGPLNQAMKALFWSDEQKEGARTFAITRYLRHESLRFDAPALLAAHVRETTPAGSSIFGDSLSAPLVALLANRRIANDEADTNYMRYESGITPAAKQIDLLESSSPPHGVIYSPGRGFIRTPEMRTWLESRYRLATTVRDPYHGDYLFYVRSAPTP